MEASHDDGRVSLYIVVHLLYWLMGYSLFSGLFLATLEVSIVSTSLITITNDLNAFGNGSWIVIAYLLTYTGIHAHAVLELYADWREDASSFGQRSATYMGESR